MSDEIEKMLPSDEEIILSNGEKIVIKSLPWGKEIKVCQLVSKFFDDNGLVDVFNIISSDEESSDFQAISKLLIPLVSNAPQVITQIISIIINQDEKYVEESLTSEDVMQIFVPFLQLLFNKYTKMFQQTNLKLVK